MTKERWIALALVVSMLVGLQHFGLERQAETIAEAPMKKVAGLPASDVLPTYVATLFFGAFRAVAVDILWIQLRKVKEEKRWYEMKEIMTFISYVQPRNPEVYSNLSWDAAYNVANGMTNPDESWKWVKFGLGWLRKGIRALPNDPYLKDQLAYTLWQKPSWRDGELDTALLARIEKDLELQAELLPDDIKADRHRSAFELAIPWLERARDDLLESDREYALTQMGLYLYPERMDGFIRACMILQGMSDWKQDRREEAKAWFSRACRQCEAMLARAPDAPAKPGFERRYKNYISPIFGDWAKMYRHYPEIVDLEYKARSGTAEDNLALLRLVQGLLSEHGPIDEHWLWDRNNPHALLNRIKLSAVTNPVTKFCGDTQECNDSFEMSTDLNAGDLAIANIAPEGLDVDFYGVRVQPPPEIQPPPAFPPRPPTVTLRFTKVGRTKLKATFYDTARRLLIQKDVPENTEKVEFQVPVKDYGRHFLKVEVEGRPKPEDTRYQFGYEVNP